MSLEKFINIHWYMERKPYDTHSVYDIFYLKICRHLFSMIEKMPIAYKEAIVLDKEQCKEVVK